MTRELVRKNVELDAKNVDWYYTMFPGGSLQGTLNALLDEFRAVMEHTPSEYAKVAANHLAEKLKNT